MQKFCVSNSYDANHNIPVWLFEILRDFDENMKARFLFYTLGTVLQSYCFSFIIDNLGCFRVPIGGFKSFPLKINTSNDIKSLPLAHTCFNQIDIPDYPTKEILKEKLIIAITEGSGAGFFVS